MTKWGSSVGTLGKWTKIDLKAVRCSHPVGVLQGLPGEDLEWRVSYCEETCVCMQQHRHMSPCAGESTHTHTFVRTVQAFPDLCRPMCTH